MEELSITAHRFWFHSPIRLYLMVYWWRRDPTETCANSKYNCTLQDLIALFEYLYGSNQINRIPDLLQWVKADSQCRGKLQQKGGIERVLHFAERRKRTGLQQSALLWLCIHRIENFCNDSRLFHGSENETSVSDGVWYLATFCAHLTSSFGQRNRQEASDYTVKYSVLLCMLMHLS